MASTQSSSVNPKDKKRYRVGNWQAYERGLRARDRRPSWPESPRSGSRLSFGGSSALSTVRQRTSTPRTFEFLAPAWNASVSKWAQARQLLP